jgi:hypothetical protein
MKIRELATLAACPPWSAYPTRFGANATVAEIMGQFQSGDGPRTRLFTDGDDFTEWLKASSHITSVRDQLETALADGQLVVGDADSNDRVISGDGFVFMVDGMNAGTGGLIGNLPESFLGSYTLGYEVNSIDEQGNASVTFTINNDTTIDSMTRIPGTDEHVPLYDVLTEANAENGTWESVHQTVVWTETIHVG